MGIITDFFIATAQEVESTSISNFPIGPTVSAPGIDTIALDIFARFLIGTNFKNVLEHVKPNYHSLESVLNSMGNDLSKGQTDSRRDSRHI
jgi:hypothetical protein